MYSLDKEITIRYSKGGINQYARFGIKDGKVVMKDFLPFYTYTNISDIPSLDGIDTIEEILKVINEFSYNGATIHLIDGELPEYNKRVKTKQYISNLKSEVENFIETKAIELFTTQILPIIKKHRWFISESQFMRTILIYKNRKTGWDNIQDCEASELIEFISHKFIRIVKGEDDIKLCPEHGRPSINSFNEFMNYIPKDVLININIFKEPNDLFEE